MKNLIKIFFLFFVSISNFYSQWINEAVDEGTEEAYHICYNYAIGTVYDEFIAKLENVNGSIAFYVASNSFCYDYDFATVSFTVQGINKYYALNGYISDDGKAVFLIDNLKTSKLLHDFKAASEMRIDFFYEGCPHSIANFDMKGSTAAYNFIKQ